MKKLLIVLCLAAAAVLVRPPQSATAAANDRPCWDCDLGAAILACTRTTFGEAGTLLCAAEDNGHTGSCYQGGGDCGAINVVSLNAAGTVIRRNIATDVALSSVGDGRVQRLLPCNGAVVAREYDESAVARARASTASLTL